MIGSYSPIPALARHDEILEVLEDQPEISLTVSQISGYALLETWASRSPVVLFGINGDTYFEAFSAVRILTGGRLRTGVPGVLISLKKAEEIGRSAGRPLVAGDPILLSVFTNRGFSIREVPLAGIFQYPTENTALERIAYVDADTLRALNGMVRGKVDLRELPTETTNFLQGDLTGIFDSSTTAKTEDQGVRVSDVERVLSDTGTTRAGASDDTGSWNFVLIKLKPGVDRRVFQRNLEDRFRLLGLEARVGDWKAAAGSGAALAGSLSVAFNIGLVLLGVVIVLILANIFYTWVIERTAEIATMRALGASKGLVVSLFFTESTILSIISAAFGVLVCSALVFWMGRRGFTTDNRILMLVFGGTKLRPLLTSRSVVGGFLGAIAVGATAILLPLRLALKVALVKAMDTE